MSSQETCYMCEQVSTSQEHVPPKCLFPESKDVDGDYRTQLITVPSCDQHNTAKSSEDEFLLVSLAGIIGNNSIGYKHKFTKVNRAIYRTSFKLLERTMIDPRLEWIEFGPNQFIDVIWSTPDYERLHNCFDHIARELYFDQFGERFDGSTRTILGYTSIRDHNAAEFQRFIHDKVAQELEGTPRHGSNPDIFTYQFTDADQFGLFVVHLQFYGRIDVYVGYNPATTPPIENFAMQLIEMGIPTVMQLGENVYTFNPDDGSAENEG
ncbi:hypothetical protein [Novipirellula rosea]|uniref:Uncharacterized protein n=1 Tax=Novipirellula rosea TaxID=1031540 RepID=A0ABP8NQ21_9BACT